MRLRSSPPDSGWRYVQKVYRPNPKILNDRRHVKGDAAAVELMTKLKAAMSEEERAAGFDWEVWYAPPGDQAGKRRFTNSDSPINRRRASHRPSKR